MDWRRTGDKPLSEPMKAHVSDAYMRHSASMSWRSDISCKMVLFARGSANQVVVFKTNVMNG